MTPGRDQFQLTQVRIEVDQSVLPGDLTDVEGAVGVIVFAHGTGSSRLSPRNRHVATMLNRAGFATLLFDLLTEDEEQADLYTAEYRFNILMLAERLTSTVDWLRRQERYETLPVGLFGTSTGAAAALICAAQRPDVVRTVVSRGGRPDLAMTSLPQVRCPALLIVGGNDEEVLRLNRRAADSLAAPHELAVVEGATHLFEEPGALDEVADLAASWFREHLT